MKNAGGACGVHCGICEIVLCRRTGRTCADVGGDVTEPARTVFAVRGGIAGGGPRLIDPCDCNFTGGSGNSGALDFGGSKDGGDVEDTEGGRAGKFGNFAGG